VWVDYIVFPPVDMPESVEETALKNQINQVVVFPNPARQEITIGFQTDQKMDVSLDIFNSSGQRIKTLLRNKSIEKGQHLIKWNGNDDSGKVVPDGLYFYRLIAGEQFAGRIVIMR